MQKANDLISYPTLYSNCFQYEILKTATFFEALESADDADDEFTYVSFATIFTCSNFVNC